MTKTKAKFFPQTSISTPLDHLYAVERHIENAEQHLMLAVEQLLHASDAHGRATSLNAHQTAPDFYSKIQARLNKTIALMAFRKELGV